MIENNDFPWYLQQTDTFSTLYYGMFDVASAASPLGLGDAFDVDKMRGAMLYRLGTYFGMSGTPFTWDGLIYDLDHWSESKRWTGGLRQIGEELYSNMIKAKAYAYGRPYSLVTLKEVFRRMFDGFDYDIVVHEHGSINANKEDNGLVTQSVTRVRDNGEVEEEVDSVRDCGTFTTTEVPINKIIIVLTAAEDVIRAFVEMRAFDLAFIGKPCGIQVVWEYDNI